MKWQKLAVFLLLALLPLALVFSQDTQLDRESLVATLQTQIDELQSIEQNLSLSDSELQTLKLQIESLKKEIENSYQVSTEQELRFQTLAKQLADLKQSKEVQLKNFEGLLTLSRKYKQQSESAQTLNYVLGGTAGALLIGLIVSILAK